MYKMHKKMGINQMSNHLPSTRPIRVPPLPLASSLLGGLLPWEIHSSPCLWLVGDHWAAETIGEPFHQ